MASSRGIDGYHSGSDITIVLNLVRGGGRVNRISRSPHFFKDLSADAASVLMLLGVEPIFLFRVKSSFWGSWMGTNSMAFEPNM